MGQGQAADAPCWGGEQYYKSGEQRTFQVFPSVQSSGGPMHPHCQVGCHDEDFCPLVLILDSRLGLAAIKGYNAHPIWGRHSRDTLCVHVLCS